MKTLHISNEFQTIKPHLNTSLVTLEGEVWKDIYGYEGSYKISSMGRVKSLKRTTIKGNIIQEHILKQWYSGSSLQVTLAVDGYKYKKNIPQLFGGSFIDFPKINEVYTHLDGNTYNNAISNISIKTKSDQVLLSYCNGILKDWGIKNVGIMTRFVSQYIYTGTFLIDKKVTKYTSAQLRLKYGTGVRSIYKCIAKQQNFNTAYNQTWNKRKITFNEDKYENSAHL